MDKKIIIAGFIFGIIVPIVATFGLIYHSLEMLKPILIPGFYIIDLFIHDIQNGNDSFIVPWYKWAAGFILNGTIYSSIFLAFSKIKENKKIY